MFVAFHFSSQVLNCLRDAQTETKITVLESHPLTPHHRADGKYDLSLSKLYETVSFCFSLISLVRRKMNTEDRKYIDDLFAGKTIFLPRKLVEILPSIRDHRGRDACALMWYRIRVGETRDRKHTEDAGVRVHTNEFEGFTTGKTIKTYREKLANDGYIEIVEKGKKGKYSTKYKTLRRRQLVEYELTSKSAHDAMSGYCQPEVACEFTRKMLDGIQGDVDGAISHYADLRNSYFNQPELSLKEMNRDQLIAYKNDHKKRKPEKTDLNGLLFPLLELIHCRGRVVRGKKGNRLFSPLTQLKKTFRPFLAMNGEPLTCIDMTCAQPTLLGHLTQDDHLIRDCLCDVFYDGIADYLNESVDTKPYVFRIGRDEAKKIFYEYIFGGNRTENSKRKDPLRVQEYFARKYPKTHRYIVEQKSKQHYAKFSRK